MLPLAKKRVTVPSVPRRRVTTRATRTYRQPERALHAHVGMILSYVKPACIYFPVPNGAADLGPKLGAMLRGQHKVYPGVSDWVFLWPVGCGCIELKTGKEQQNDDQKRFEASCESRGVPYRVARSVEEVLQILEEWGRLPLGMSKRIRGLE